MKTFKKAILLVACAALLVGASIMGTLAFLQDKTETITNTMTVGNVEITLDEALVNIQGEKLNKDGAVAQDGDLLADRITNGNSYKLVPGKTYIKDPTIHVAAGSENCYLFVKVENGIAGIEYDDAETKNIAEQLEEKGWEPLANGSNVYYNENGVAGTDVVLFEHFRIKDDVKNNDLATYADKTIAITAYAVQKAGFNSATEAWDATFGLNP